MSKLPPLTDIGSGYNLKETYNANNEKIEEAFQNTLSRDGSAPNMMEAELDMNSWRIINLGRAVAPGDAVTFQQLAEAQVSGDFTTASMIWFLAGDGATATFPVPGAFSTNANDYIVTLNGVRQTPGYDYSIFDQEITFFVAPSVHETRIVVQTAGSVLAPDGVTQGVQGPPGPPGPQGDPGIYVSESPPPDPYPGMLWLQISA
jgi:hypothetical protein